MYKNVQVNHYNNAATPASSFPSASLSRTSQTTTTSLPVQITSASSSSTTPITRPPPPPSSSSSLHSSNIGVSSGGDGGISLPVSFDTTKEIMSVSSGSKIKSDVDQLDDLVKDLLTEVNRPIGGGGGGSSNIGTSNNNRSNKPSTSSYSYHRRFNHDGNENIHANKLPSSYTQASTLNNGNTSKRNDFDANAVSGLIDGSSNGVQREEQRSKSTREERIRIKRGGGQSSSELPVTSSSSMTTTTTVNKPQLNTTSRDQLFIDEQLIDSLLESVQNTLRKRAQHKETLSSSGWTSDHHPPPPQHHHPHHPYGGSNNRRTYSSSAAYTDSVHRMDPTRGRFPIKLHRTDSPTSTLSSRRPYSRMDNRDGFATTQTSASTTAIPTHFRANSEPPPEGPIELRRMDLLRSPSRTYIDGHPHDYYAHQQFPRSGGLRVRGQDYSGYETDTGLVTSRGYGSRYYGGPPAPPPPPPPMYPYYPQQPIHFVRDRYHETHTLGGGGHQRSMLRPDGYDTDTGLISSGRLRMTRTLPPRMAAIPETLVVNNRMVSSSNLNTLPTHLRGSAFLNETNNNNNIGTLRGGRGYASESGGGGYETDSGMHIRQQGYGRRQVPVDIQYGDSGWVGKQQQQSQPARPISQQQYRQQQTYHSQQQLPDSHRYHQSQYHSQDQLRSGVASIPVFTNNDPSVTMTRLPEQHISTSSKSQQKRTTPPPPPAASTVETKSRSSAVDTTRKDISILPTLFPGSVGLSNPPSSNKLQQPPSPELKRKFSGDNVLKRPARPQRTIIESSTLQTTEQRTPVTNDPITIKPPQIFSTSAEIVPNVGHERLENHGTVMNSKTPPTPTFPVTTQSFNQNVQPRVGNSLRNPDESSRRSSVSSTAESDVTRNGAYQAHNVSQFWYKEKLSREDAINLLKTKPPGTFLIRDSQGFPGSFGLAVKVETLPPGIQAKPGADPNAELVRHYLIERTQARHVRLKGCANEPDFPNLSALVYQHSLTPLALPIKLLLPVADITEDYVGRPLTSQSNPQETRKMSVKDLLEKGAACNVLYLNNVDVQSLTGQMAVVKALRATFDNADRLQATIVHFKVSSQGITLTDTKKKVFSRHHFPKEHVTYCGVDYESDRFWTHQYPDLEMLPRAKCFGFVKKRTTNGNKTTQPENECYIFAEIDPAQPSTAIVNFVSKVMIGSVPV